MMNSYKHRNLRKATAIFLSIALVVGCGFPAMRATATERNNTSADTVQLTDSAKSDDTATSKGGDEGASETNESADVDKQLTNLDNKEVDEEDDSSNGTASDEQQKSEDKDETVHNSSDDKESDVATLSSVEVGEVAGPAAVYVPFAVYSADDYSFRIYNRGDPVPSAGSTYNGRTVTNVFSDFDGKGADTNPSWRTGFSSLGSVKTFIVEDYWKPSNSGDLRGFAAGFSGMTYADVANIDTSSATTFFNFFCDDSALQTVRGLQKWNTSNVTNLQGFAARCSSLKELNLTSWNTKKVTNAYAAFGTDQNDKTMSISHIYVGDNFDFSNVTNSTWLFGGDKNLPNYMTSVANAYQNATYAKLTSSSGYLETTVCKIEPTSSTSAATYYSSVASAIDAAVNGSTISIFKNNTTGFDDFNISGRNITLRNDTESDLDWSGSSAVTSWSDGDQRWTITQSGSMTLDGVIFDGANYNHTNPFIIIYTGAPTLNIKGNTQLRNHTRGGAIQILNTSGTLNISGGRIYNNRTGINILSGSSSAKLNITGGSIENCSSSSDTSAGGVRFATSATISSINISGNSTIKNNSMKGTTMNVETSGASTLKIGDLAEGASVGVYSTDNYEAEKQFATGQKSAVSITNLTTSVRNDRNSNLKALSGGGTKIIWGIPACKLVTASNEAHYSNIATAVSDATSGATGERIEIYKSHTVSSSMDTSNKPLTIMNIVDPKYDFENPNKNGSSDKPPLVTFAADARLVCNSDIVLKGVIFDGLATVGTPITRTTSAIANSSGCTLTVKDGETGTLAKTETRLSNFYNSTSSNSTGGGCLNVSGTTTIESGTITGCKSESDGSTGGGAAALINGGTLNFNDGAIKNNGEYKSGGAHIGAIAMWGGTFNMTGGVASGNKGSHGGFLVCDSSTKNTVNITGGQILDNSCYYDGGALYFNYNVTVLIGGDVIIAKNFANRSGSAIGARAGSSITVTDRAVITKNSCGSAGNTLGQGAICCLHYDSRPHLAVSGNPVIKGNTNSNGAESNINLGYSDDFEVGVLGAGALIGYYSENGTQSAGSQFAYSNQASAAQSGYLNTLTNDSNKTYVGVDGGATAIKWSSSANANVKIAESRTIGSGTDYQEQATFTHLFEDLDQAFSCAQQLATENMVDGAYTAEVLVESLPHGSQASLSTGSSKPIILTTASSSASDGYAYRGTSGTNATVKRTYNGGSMISLSAGDDGTASDLTIKDITLDGNSGTYSCSGSGGAISSLHSIVILAGSTQIINNEADGFSAIEVGNGTSATSSDDQLYIQDFAVIKNNTNSASTDGEKAGAVGTCNTGRTILSGSIQIYDNKDSSGNQQNLFDGTAKDDGSNIQVNSTGLSSDAKIGVSAINNCRSQNTFARTATSPSSEYSNLGVFINDKYPSMDVVGTSGNDIMWLSNVPVTLKKTISESQDTDVWFTVKIRRNSDNADYRQVIKIEAGQTEGGATVILSAGDTYDFIDVDSQSSWRYATDSATTSDFADNDVWLAGDDPTVYIGRLELVPDENDAHNRKITFATMLNDDKFVSDTTGVINSMS